MTIFSLENCHVVVVAWQLPQSTLSWPLFRAWCSTPNGQSWFGMSQEWATLKVGCQEPSQATR